MPNCSGGYDAGRSSPPLTTLTSVANETRLGNDIAVECRFEGRGLADTFSVPGHDSRARPGDLQPAGLTPNPFPSPGGKGAHLCRRVKIGN